MSESERGSRFPAGATQRTLSRDEIIDGLRELIRALHRDGRPARMQIVGGAAIALTVDADRRATQDVDGPLTPSAVIVAAAEEIARARAWPIDWVNDSASQFVPGGFGREAEWVTIYQNDDVLIQVALPDMLLAMKLHAAQKRDLREAGDLAVLLSATGIDAAEDAERLYSDFYPGEGFTIRLFTLVETILAAPRGVKPALQTPDLS